MLASVVSEACSTQVEQVVWGMEVTALRETVAAVVASCHEDPLDHPVVGA